MNIRELILSSCLIVSITLFGYSCQKISENGASNAGPDMKIIQGMAHIPAGEFIMGSDKVDKDMMQQRFGMKKIPYQNEHPQRKVNLNDYYIDQYEVTNKQYKEFVKATQYISPPYWGEGNVYNKILDNIPVVMVSWFNADSYCRWKGKRLPTEVEWEKAARGVDGRVFPWGDEFDQKKLNGLGLNGGPTPVGQFKEDVSTFGVYDVSGNVSEWVVSWYKPYPGNKFLDEAYGEKLKVLRGGSWGGIGHYSFDMFYRTSFRNSEKPEAILNDVGFRCAYSAS